MATLQAQLSVALTDGSDNIPFNWNYSKTVTGAPYANNEIVVGTSEETLPLVEVSSIGMIAMINKGSANVTVGGAAGTRPIIIRPGRWIQFETSWTTLYIAAASGTCNVKYLIATA